MSTIDLSIILIIKSIYNIFSFNLQIKGIFTIFKFMYKWILLWSMFSKNLFFGFLIPCVYIHFWWTKQLLLATCLRYAIFDYFPPLKIKGIFCQIVSLLTGDVLQASHEYRTSGNKGSRLVMVCYLLWLACKQSLIIAGMQILRSLP